MVPRPIGWISTWGSDGVANLAPYSFFNAISGSPMLVAASIGLRKGDLKDTLVNVRERKAFCVNTVTEPFLDAMNATSAEVSGDVDEFALAGLECAASDRIDAPFVALGPAVLECRLFKEVDLAPSANVLIIGEVVGVRLSEDLTLAPETMLVDSEGLRPVGRMSGAEYMLPRETRRLQRP